MQNTCPVSCLKAWLVASGYTPIIILAPSLSLYQYQFGAEKLKQHEQIFPGKNSGNDKMKPLIKLETVRQILQEMRNAFQLFDRDGDGTINAKVTFILTLARKEANNLI